MRTLTKRGSTILLALATLAPASTTMAQVTNVQVFLRRASNQIGHWSFHVTPDTTWFGTPSDNAEIEPLTSPGAAMSDLTCAIYDHGASAGSVVANYFRDSTHMDDAYSNDGVHFTIGSWDAPGGAVVDGVGPIVSYAWKPGTASLGDGRIDMFAVINMPHIPPNIYHRVWDRTQPVNGQPLETQWRPFLPEGVASGPVGPGSSPVAVAWTWGGVPRVDVFWRARANVDPYVGLGHAWTTGDLSSFGGSDLWPSHLDSASFIVGATIRLIGDPTVISPADGVLDVFQQLELTDGVHYAYPTWHWHWSWGTLQEEYITTFVFGFDTSFGYPSGQGPSAAAIDGTRSWLAGGYRGIESVITVVGDAIDPNAGSMRRHVVDVYNLLLDDDGTDLDGLYPPAICSYRSP
jgi:hypothetical protein